MDENRTSEELVYFQTNLLTLTIKGAASHPNFPGVIFTEKESSLCVSCDDSFEIHLAGDAEKEHVQRLGSVSYGKYKLCPLFFEQQRYEIIVEPEEGYNVEFWHDNYNVRKNVTPVGRKSNMLSGVINFGNEIGMSDLIVLVDGKRYLKLTIEVFPSKISYKDDYKAIVSDVTAEVLNLVFDFLKKTYESFNTSSKKLSSLVEFFAIIYRIYEKYMSAVDIVVARPHHVLEREHTILPSHKIKRIDNNTLRWIEKHPSQTKIASDHFWVERALSERKFVTYNTKENQLAKYMLQSTARRLKNFRIQYLRIISVPDPAVVNQIDIMIRGIQRRIDTSFLREIDAVPVKSSLSLVFSMAPGYRDLFQCYLLLHRGLSITDGIYNVSVKDLAALYEYWCFIKLNSILKNKYELCSQDIIRVNGNGICISLVKGQGSRVCYRNANNDEIITLSYNLSEYKGPTVSQKPDNVLCLVKKGALINYEYVFDAKYKINPATKGSRYFEFYHTPGPQEEDINTMHRYRDAILCQSEAKPYERIMFGAYILFPYNDEETYRNHKFYNSINRINIGGLPFLPRATSLVTEFIDKLISDSPIEAYKRATLPKGYNEMRIYTYNMRSDEIE